MVVEKSSFSPYMSVHTNTEASFNFAFVNVTDFCNFVSGNSNSQTK